VKPRILVVDDEHSVCKFFKIMFEKEGFLVETRTDPREALRLIENGEKFVMVFVDVIMPEMNGIEFLKEVHRWDPSLKVVIITAYASVESSVSALRAGAFDYITKPFKIEDIKATVSRAIENEMLKRENRLLREVVSGYSSSLDQIIGTDEKIIHIKELIKKIAPTDSPILIVGESGTGKELVARAIHELSGRAKGSFVTINCGALPETLLESELFGYTKGAFTGAIKDKDGLFKVADGGTFFLDEIGELQMSLQVKLLRALETKEIIPVGATKPIEVDVRIISATNADLESKIKEGTFRADLYYRLNVFSIHIPPLRERRGDIIPIANQFIVKQCAKAGVPVKRLSKEAMKILESAYWYGNVRELENVIERAILLAAGDEITPKHLPNYLLQQKEPQPFVSETPIETETFRTLEEIEKAYIFWVLTKTDWQKYKAAKILGIDPSTLYRKIEKYGLENKE